MESPTPDEIKTLIDEFSLPTLVAEELLLPSSKTRLEFHPGFAYVVLHFPALRHTHRSVEQEIDFVIGHNFLITVRYETVDPLHHFSKVFQVNSILEHSNIEHAGYLFFYMVKRLYKAVEQEIDHVRQDLQEIEKGIFGGKEVAMVNALAVSGRELLNLRQAIEPHREILKTLETDGSRFFDTEFHPYLRAMSNEYYRVHNHVTRHTESLHELRETNNSLLTTKQNETMRVLTIMALLTFPLALFVAIFDINAKHNPIIGLPYDFWIIVGVVLSGGSLMLWYFKHKHWL